MALIPAQYDDIATKIYEHYEKSNGPDAWREHLGASEIGHPCNRKIWYGFHWSQRPQHMGRLLRLFKRGHNEEQSFVDDLRAIGAEVYDTDPRTGKQIQVAAWYGHFGGSLDGVARHLPHRGDKWHLLEFKTHSSKSFNKLKTQGVEKSKYQHYCQMQIYMGFERLERALYCAVNKDTDDLYFEVIAFNESTFKALCDKAEMIVFSQYPPGRISDKADSEHCKWCDFQNICHFNKPPDQSCRTCRFSEPRRDGKWHCNFAFLPDYHASRDKTELTKQEQIAACEEWEAIESFKGEQT